MTPRFRYSLPALALALLALLAAHVPLEASQLDFQRRLRDGVWEYSIAFVDGQRRRHSALFRLDTKAVDQASKMLQSPEAVYKSLAKVGESNLRALERQLAQSAQEMMDDVLLRTRHQANEMMLALPSGSRILIDYNPDTSVYKFTGHLARDYRFWKYGTYTDIMEQSIKDIQIYFQMQLRERERALDIMRNDFQRDLQLSVDAAKEQLFNDGLMVRNEYKSLRIDYRAATRKSLWHLRGLSQSLDSIGTDRERADKVLGFFQSIPYEVIDDRHASSSLGFRMPAVTIDQNLGDCDSKAIGAAAVLKNLMPHRGVLLVLIPGHALLAMQLTPSKGDELIYYGGSHWVLLEPVGPGLHTVGSIGAQSKAGLLKGERVSYVEL